MKAVYLWLRSYKIIFASVLVLISALLIVLCLLVNPYSGIGGDAAHFYYQRSGDRDRVRDTGSIRASLEVYWSEHGSYPSVLTKLVSEGLISQASIEDPVTKAVYQYAKSADDQKYVLRSSSGECKI